ncbi:MAG: hypothetical protein IT305_00875 [Chloroflexi bacterium]|nr:hypothetical protein [Chloroflexota bacterium]
MSHDASGNSDKGGLDGRPDWSAPLPDLSQPAVDTRLRVGPYVFQILISPVEHAVPGEPDTDLVQLMVLLGGQPLTLHDLGAATARCSFLWTYLCGRLIDATVDFYDPQPLPSGEQNPRLGCWGTRPDLIGQSSEDDCTLSVVIGLSTWRVGARPRADDTEYVRELGATLAEALAFWVLRIAQDRTAESRRDDGA